MLAHNSDILRTISIFKNLQFSRNQAIHFLASLSTDPESTKFYYLQEIEERKFSDIFTDVGLGSSTGLPGGIFFIPKIPIWGDFGGH
jgi:hypothetical protein